MEISRLMITTALPGLMTQSSLTYNNDAMRAEADGSGLNNANFATSNDGSAPRMQMFLWGALSRSF
jgi:hypothetical protein